MLIKNKQIYLAPDSFEISIRNNRTLCASAEELEHYEEEEWS